MYFEKAASGRAVKTENTAVTRRALREHSPLARPVSDNIHQTSEKKLQIQSK